MVTTKNPHARIVQNNDIRESEFVFTELIPGMSPRIMAEVFSFSPADTSSQRDVHIGGNNGIPGSKPIYGGVRYTFVLQKGADASLWKSRWLAQKAGQPWPGMPAGTSITPEVTLKKDVSDKQSPAIGREITWLTGGTLENYVPAGGTGGGTGTMRDTITIYFTGEELVDPFAALPGVM